MQILNDKNFNEFLTSNKNVVVDFFAEWCGPCRALAPVMEELGSEYKDKGVEIVKVNIDDAPETAEKFGIMSIPTMVYFKNGEVKETSIGLLPKDNIKSKIEELIK